MSESSSCIVGNDEELTFKPVGLYDLEQILMLTTSKLFKIVRVELFNNHRLNRGFSSTGCYNFTTTLERAKSCVCIPRILYFEAGRLLPLPYIDLLFQ